MRFSDVHKTIGNYMLADGMSPVIDLDKSHGSWLVDGNTGDEYLDMFSYVSIGYIWLKMLNISYKKNKNRNTDFLSAKIATGKYYLNKVMPKTSFLKQHIFSGASSYNDYEDIYFESGFN